MGTLCFQLETIFTSTNLNYSCVAYNQCPMLFLCLKFSLETKSTVEFLDNQLRTLPWNNQLMFLKAKIRLSYTLIHSIFSMPYSIHLLIKWNLLETRTRPAQLIFAVTALSCYSENKLSWSGPTWDWDSNLSLRSNWWAVKEWHLLYFDDISFVFILAN